ncbi:hypothetical protein Bbelb_363900 [Branchiostoma belcheri]|nr:hypothetical protein Bbelb_363900 [Branchiostoma belcheri]
MPTSPRRRRLWIQYVQRRRNNWTGGAKAELCSRHFSSDQFVGGLEREFGIRKRVQLKPTAVPDVHAFDERPAKSGASSAVSGPRTAFEKRRRQQIIADLLEPSAQLKLDALDNGYEVCLIALDIKGAFDKVWHNGLCSKLRSKGVCGKLLMWIESYLSDRSIKVVLSGQSSTTTSINASVPQGSILGPLLFSVFIDDVGDGCESPPYLYADDSTLYYVVRTNDDRASAAVSLNRDLERMRIWAEKWKVTIEPTKCKTMTISRKRSRARSDLFFGNTKLAEKDELEILGVTIDNKLSWTKLTLNTAARAGQKLGAMRRVAHKLTPSGRAAVYKAQARSVMEYASLCWMSAPATSLGLLDSVQRRALKIIGTNEQEARLTLNIPSLQHRRQVAAAALLYKMHTDTCPAGLKTMLTKPYTFRRTTRTSLAMPTHALAQPVSRTGRTFIHTGVQIWNQLPDTIVGNIYNNGLQSFKDQNLSQDTVDIEVVAELTNSVGTQTKSSGRHRATQVTPARADAGVHSSPHPRRMRTPKEELSDTDSDDLETEEIHLPDESVPPQEERKYLVFHSALLQLFSLCLLCGSGKQNLRLETIGSFLAITSLSAKYGSYTLMDVRTNKILTLQLVQSNEVGSSNAMEKEGLARAVDFIRRNCTLQIGKIVTDRHIQIAKWIRENLPETCHLYDIWHIAKDTKASVKIYAIITKKSLLKDIRRLSPKYQTAHLEAFHSTINHFDPKWAAFFYMGMLSRLHLAALHHNENCGRGQARNKAGERIYKIRYKKFKKSCTVQAVQGSCTFATPSTNWR